MLINKDMRIKARTQRGQGSERNGARGKDKPSYPAPTPRPLITASQLSSSPSFTGPNRSMPFSSFDSMLCHVSSSLIRRLVALREEEPPPPDRECLDVVDICLSPIVDFVGSTEDDGV